MDDHGGNFNIFELYRNKRRNKHQKKRESFVPHVNLGMPGAEEYEVPPVDSYINIELQSAQPTPSGQEHIIMCKCNDKPKECLCFRRKCIMHRNDGTTYITYVSPPPSPILRHHISEWSIGDDDHVYIRVDETHVIKSKIKYSEYLFPHCHEEQCIQVPHTAYDDFVMSDTPKANFISSYEQYMYPVLDDGKVATVVYPTQPQQQPDSDTNIDYASPLPPPLSDDRYAPEA